jgi:hypothetical protein
MPAAGFSISSTGAQDYRALAKRLRVAGKRDGRGDAKRSLRAALRKQITDAGKPIVDEVKATVRTLPVKGTRGGGTKKRRDFNVSRATTERAQGYAKRRKAGLRASIAAATRLQVTAKGIRIIVDSSKLPEGQRTLPRHLDSAKGWRHPVFGDTHTWVGQQGKPYFGVTIKKRAPAFRKAILGAMETIKTELEK